MAASVPFVKMQGLGNDFVILDRRTNDFKLQALNIVKLADRKLGVGCDQVIILSESERADVRMRIFNADGGEAEACGNATRCVGALLLRDKEKVAQTTIETAAGILKSSVGAKGEISVVLPPPMLDWQQVPLAEAMDTLRLPIAQGALIEPCTLSVGNPHLVFFVEDVSAIALEQVGPLLEHHPLFPERTNVELVQIEAPGKIAMRVWERGAGLTQACGTGACAALVAAVRRGLSDRKAMVQMPGGSLHIEWRPESLGGEIIMSGGAQEVFRGTFDLAAFLA